MSDIPSKPDTEPKPSRRLFRRAAIAMLIGGSAVGIGINAFAHGEGGGWRCGGGMARTFDPATMDEHLDGMLKHVYAEIDATEEQKQRLAPIVKQAAQDLLPVRERVRTGRAKAMELFTRDSLDRAAIEALRAEHLQLAEQASQRLVRALADAAEVLTPAQRQKLAAHIQQRHGGGWHHG